MGLVFVFQEECRKGEAQNAWISTFFCSLYLKAHFSKNISISVFA